MRRRRWTGGVGLSCDGLHSLRPFWSGEIALHIRLAGEEICDTPILFSTDFVHDYAQTVIWRTWDGSCVC